VRASTETDYPTASEVNTPYRYARLVTQARVGIYCQAMAVIRRALAIAGAACLALSAATGIAVPTASAASAPTHKPWRISALLSATRS
jgi:hypothetical protein